LVSKTIYSHYLPVVTGTSPFNGKLTKTEKSRGIANLAEIVEIYADVGGKVEEVYVKEGESVEKGQELFRLSFDKDQILQSLKELDVSISQKSIEISGLQRQIDAMSEFDIRQLQSEIDIAADNLAKIKILYEAGAVAKDEYDTLQNDLNALRDKKTEAEKNYVDERESLRKEIARAKLDLQSFNIQQETYQNTLNKFDNNAVVCAGGTGQLTQFSINQGQRIADGYFVGKIGCGNTYEIDCDLSLDNNFVVTGDSCKLKNTNHSFAGTVSKITLTEEAKKITIAIQSDDISLGETFDVTFEKESAESYTLVPNGALNLDNDGYYLYQLKRQDGMLGQEYYAQKLRVYIGDNDDNNTAITKGLSFLEPVVLTSNKAFSEGQSLNLANVGDFFEN